MSAEGIPSEWYFITAPQDVSWRKNSVSKEVATYGTNNPYLNYGTTKLRKLTLSNAMVEGFSNAMQVEDNIVQLEACMRMIIDEGTGFAAPYCWQAFAGNKSYGTFIITGVKVKEELRDMSGKATRAFVDIELQEVPPYQVSSGQDITSSAATLGGDIDSRFVSEMNSQAAGQDAAVAAANGGGTAADGGADGADGGKSDAPKVDGISAYDASDAEKSNNPWGGNVDNTTYTPAELAARRGGY